MFFLLLVPSISLRHPLDFEDHRSRLINFSVSLLFRVLCWASKRRGGTPAPPTPRQTISPRRIHLNPFHLNKTRKNLWQASAWPHKSNSWQRGQITLLWPNRWRVPDITPCFVMRVNRQVIWFLIRLACALERYSPLLKYPQLKSSTLNLGANSAILLSQSQSKRCFLEWVILSFTMCTNQGYK